MHTYIFINIKNLTVGALNSFFAEILMTNSFSSFIRLCFHRTTLKTLGNAVLGTKQLRMISMRRRHYNSICMFCS